MQRSRGHAREGIGPRVWLRTKEMPAGASPIHETQCHGKLVTGSACRAAQTAASIWGLLKSYPVLGGRRWYQDGRTVVCRQVGHQQVGLFASSLSHHQVGLPWKTRQLSCSYSPGFRPYRVCVAPESCCCKSGTMVVHSLYSVPRYGPNKEGPLPPPLPGLQPHGER